MRIMLSGLTIFILELIDFGKIDCLGYFSLLIHKAKIISCFQKSFSVEILRVLDTWKSLIITEYDFYEAKCSSFGKTISNISLKNIILIFILVISFKIISDAY